MVSTQQLAKAIAIVKEAGLMQKVSDNNRAKKIVEVRSDAMTLAKKALKAKMKLAVGVYTGEIKSAGTTKNGNPIFKLKKVNGKWSKQLLNANGKLQWKKGWSNTKR